MWMQMKLVPSMQIGDFCQEYEACLVTQGNKSRFLLCPERSERTEQCDVNSPNS